VLAVATHVARREGLLDPVPITKVFPHAPETEESDWQEVVVRHLGLREWQRVVIDDELDLVGPLASTNLAAHGVVWPPTIHGDGPILERVKGGSLLDGEGGDEVLGVDAHRIAPVTYLVNAPRPLRWRRVRAALGAVAPTWVRARHMRLRWAGRPLPWLRPAAHAMLAAEAAAAEASAPLSFATSARMVPTRRTQVLLAHNRRLLAQPHGVEQSSPLLHPEVVHALARLGGRLGRGDRTAILRSLVADLLPDAVLARTSKASFGGAFWSRHARSFAARWNGEGVDADLVDADELRRWWLSGRTSALTSALLQQAWLAEHQLMRSPRSSSGIR
jgi:asparagine synthase (glutamine-hydrolysing)